MTKGPLFNVKLIFLIETKGLGNRLTVEIDLVNWALNTIEQGLPYRYLRPLFMKKL